VLPAIKLVMAPRLIGVAASLTYSVDFQLLNKLTALHLTDKQVQTVTQITQIITQHNPVVRTLQVQLAQSTLFYLTLVKEIFKTIYKTIITF